MDAIVFVGLALFPVSGVLMVSEYVGDRRRHPRRPRGQAWTHRVGEHPEIVALLEQGWRLKEYRPALDYRPD